MTGLSPWVLILALSIWGKALGLLGLILAIPASCLMLAMYRRFLAASAAAPQPPAPPNRRTHRNQPAWKRTTDWIKNQNRPP